MSYDVNFAIKEQNTGEMVNVYSCVTNITYNVHDLIERSSGWDTHNEDNGFVKDLIPKIQKGLEELTKYPEKYKKYESSNGWGTIKGVKRFYTDILEAWEETGSMLSPLYMVREYLYMYID